LHVLLLEVHHRRGLIHGEREPGDDLVDDRSAHRDLLGPRVVAVHRDRRHRLAGARRRDREVLRDHQQHVELGALQLRERRVGREVLHGQGVDLLERRHERLARGGVRLVVDRERHLAERAEVEGPEDEQQHERHDEREEDRGPVAQVCAQIHEREPQRLAHQSSRSSWPVRSRNTSSRVACCWIIGFVKPRPRSAVMSVRGGSIAMISPWSITATRSQSTSASSM